MIAYHHLVQEIQGGVVLVVDAVAGIVTMGIAVLLVRFGTRQWDVDNQLFANVPAAGNKLQAQAAVEDVVRFRDCATGVIGLTNINA